MGAVRDGCGVLLVGAFTVWQRLRADHKAEWWRRTQWAMDKALSEDDELSSAGYAVLKHQARRRLARKDERDLLNAFGLRHLALFDPEGDNGDHESEAEEVRHDDV